MKKIGLLFLSVASFSFGISQIVYTDIIPDDTLIPSYTSDSYSIDFDNDLNPELVVFSLIQDTVISSFPVTLTGIAITTLGSTEIVAQINTIGNEDVVVADTMKTGSYIGSTSAYLSSSTPSVFPGVGIGIQSDFSGIAVGDFIGNGDLYVGVKFMISTNVHYGWVRVKVAPQATSGILYDFAYQSIADSSILAGATEMGFTGISSIEVTNALIYSSNKKIYINSDLDFGNLTVYNLLGKQVLNTTVNKDEVINAENLNSGIYLVSLTGGNTTVTKKIFIK